MVLAKYGIHVQESTLESQAAMEAGGTLISELARLAQQYNLLAEIRNSTIDDLRQILDEGKVPIAYIDRSVFDLTPSQRVKHPLHRAVIHAVIPTYMTAKTVVCHDPLVPTVKRRAIRLFELAHRRLTGVSLVCSTKPPHGRHSE